MDKGDEARHRHGKDILASGIIAKISHIRRSKPTKGNRVYVVNSVKHPEEVKQLRGVYGDAFFLVGVNADRQYRMERLRELDPSAMDSDIEMLIERDQHAEHPHGQHVSDTFHLADCFVNQTPNSETRMKHELHRFVDLLYNHPNHTPTFDEYAMSLAYAASLRSGDLSRQVGAIIAREEYILATGANDSPRAGGGVYWPTRGNNGEFGDVEGGRDYKRGYDNNKREQEDVMRSIAIELMNEVPGLPEGKALEAIRRSRFSDGIEFGRSVHAEMDALLTCSRLGMPTRDATLYCTTFPCHNCAKHIIAAGIQRVVYVEPYRKSLALKFHADAISTEPSREGDTSKVIFEPFVGVGPRRFTDLFSMELGSGRPKKRKKSDGVEARAWNATYSGENFRFSPRSSSYTDMETTAAENFRFKRRRRTNEQRT